MLMKDGDGSVGQATFDIISSLVGHGMHFFEALPPTDPSSDDIRAKIMKSTTFLELGEDEKSLVRMAVFKATSMLAGYGMNLLRSTTTNSTFFR